MDQFQCVKCFHCVFEIDDQWILIGIVSGVVATLIGVTIVVFYFTKGRSKCIQHTLRISKGKIA